MNSATLFRRVAIMQVLLALGAFAVADRNEWFLIAGGILTVASSYVTEGPRGKHLPNWVIGPGVVLAVIWGGANFTRQLDPAAVGSIVGAVVLAILMLKLYGKKGPSDWRQILALTVVIVVDAALNSTELLAGLLVMAYAGTAIAAAMLHQMYSGALAVDAERGRPSGVSTVPISGQGAARQLRRLLVVSVVMGLLMSMVVFVLFPRDPAMGRGWGRGGRQSGFSAELNLRAGDRITPGSREVFSVRMLDPQGKPTQFTGPLHLRGAVLDSYNRVDCTWTAGRAIQPIANLEVPGGETFTYLSQEAAEERVNVWTQVVDMRTLASDYAFSMWLPIGIALDAERVIGVNTQSAVIRTVHRSGLPGRYMLKVQEHPSPRLVQSICPVTSNATTVTFPVPDVVSYANTLLSTADMQDLPTEAEAEADPALRYERNKRVANWFSNYLRSGPFVYSTDLSRFVMRSEEDPNLSFLTRYRFGHCEFFASGLAALCRSVGVEARVVTGYAISEYDPIMEQYVIRESNAHAWVEVRTGEWRWETLDPSPAQQLLEVQNANRSWLDQFRWLFDPLEFVWQSRVVNFDSGSQSDLAETMRGRLEGSLRSAADWVGEAVERVNRWFRLGPAGYIWLGLVGVVAGIAVVAVWVIVRRDRVVRRRLGARHTHAAVRARLGRDAGFYLDALDVLERHGLAKPKWKTPQAFAQELAANADPDVGAKFAAVVERFYSVRYAGKRPNRTQRLADVALVAPLKEALSQAGARRNRASIKIKNSGMAQEP